MSSLHIKTRRMRKVHTPSQLTSTFHQSRKLIELYLYLTNQIGFHSNKNSLEKDLALTFKVLLDEE
jgi:hypothetical protein